MDGREIVAWSEVLMTFRTTAFRMAKRIGKADESLQALLGEVKRFK